MQTFFCCVLLASSAAYVTARGWQEPPQQSLNHYVAFINQSVDEVVNRFQQLQTYYADVKRYRQRPDVLLRLPSSGPLETYYYEKALASSGLTAAEKQRLTARAQALWQLLTKLDQTGKALETYVRLKDYQRDELKQSDALLNQMQALSGQFSRDKDDFYKQIQRVYRRYQPYLAEDAYLYTEREMEQVLLSQKQLLDSLPFYLKEESRSDWPVGRVQAAMLADERLLTQLGKAQTALDYPASDMVPAFKTALRSLQDIKRRAVDDHTFAARQTSAHGNEVYRSLLAHYNQDLLASHQAFVNYSQSTKRLLSYPKYCPVFAIEPPASAGQSVTQAMPFRDVPPGAFVIKPAPASASNATFQALNGYVEFINESLRQMHTLQVLLRNYQASAEYYRDPARSRQRAGLTYAHEAYKVPLSEYQLLVSSSREVPTPYRASINGQADVLLAMLKEMDALSIELINYTAEKRYLQDRLQRSDAILNRYAYLFDLFDQKKERLYQDVRRVHESYPVANPADSWHVAGKALLKTLDDDHDVLFGIKAYLKGEVAHLPMTDKLAANARALIADEYKNLQGLKRFGRSNGLCPYSPYEDVAENSIRFVEKTQHVNVSSATSHPYESIYYFYNNELIYQYNKFSELAKTGILKAVNQPDMFIFRRATPAKESQALPEKVDTPNQSLLAQSKPESTAPKSIRATPEQSSDPPVKPITNGKTVEHDTVFVERTRTDTIYVDRTAPRADNLTLKGFAANNMVLLLDVSASMESPYKMPLLKRSIKSLLKLLRPEDQVSVVVYSGKARVALKPTSGANADEIARVIDDLQSKGDTDGDEGIRLAYKLADKHYIRAGNNRIILATDGEFPISNDVYQLVSDGAQQAIYLTVFTFGRNAITGANLKRIALSGKGNYAHITQENANIQLIMEAQAKKAP
ncbi:VWA domain-containing protein [Spirosoma soli]|uniref:VWA domain-containing protein n=1 Tax=Spirosoma soli TaxID=1770529 RepID=A0ABW5MCX9_9BACT